MWAGATGKWHLESHPGRRMGVGPGGMGTAVGKGVEDRSGEAVRAGGCGLVGQELRSREQEDWDFYLEASLDPQREGLPGATPLPAVPKGPACARLRVQPQPSREAGAHRWRTAQAAGTAGARVPE